jgi:NTP pyrophosphatase (non-canonical NTP hydrolase)
MDFREYHEEMRRTASQFAINNENLCLAAMGIAGEAGEVADYIKKVVFHSHELSKEKIAEELGDVLWYMTYLCEMIGYDLGQIADMNSKKLRKRYPEGWDEERSKNREEQAYAKGGNI